MARRERFKWDKTQRPLFAEHQRCRRCDRFLQSEKARERGLGETCWRKSRPKKQLSTADRKSVERKAVGKRKRKRKPRAKAKG